MNNNVILYSIGVWPLEYRSVLKGLFFLAFAKRKEKRGFIFVNLSFKNINLFLLTVR